MLAISTSAGARTLKLGSEFRVDPTPSLRAELAQILGPEALAAPRPAPPRPHASGAERRHGVAIPALRVSDFPRGRARARYGRECGPRSVAGPGAEAALSPAVPAPCWAP